MIQKSLRTVAASCGALSLTTVISVASASGTWTSTDTKGWPTLAKVTYKNGLAASTPIHIAVSLRLRNLAQLQSFITQVNTPGNPSFGKFLTPAQFAAGYAPTQDAALAVVNYLSQNGFTNIQLAPNRLVLTADGTIGSAQQAFNTQFTQIQLANGQTAFLNTTDAQVPVALGSIVQAVLGLHSVQNFHTFNVRTHGIPSTSSINGYTPQNFWQAYDVAATPTGGATNIAIIAEGNLTGTGTDVESDLRQFEKTYKLPQVPYTLVPVGSTHTDTSGNGEWQLDTQSSTGMAGTVEHLYVYDGQSLGDADLVPEFNQFVTDNFAQAASASFGGCEFIEGLSGSATLGTVANPVLNALGLGGNLGLGAFDQVFAMAASQGKTIFSSTGDTGAACPVLPEDTNGVTDTGALGGVNFPASSPYVIGVGGTNLLVDSSGNYSVETAWEAGGGGTSLFEPSPTWQQPVLPTGSTSASPVNACTSGSGTSAISAPCKGVPDIAMDGGDTGADIVIGGSLSQGVSGTSLSSPLSLGVWSRIQSSHANMFGAAGPVLYAAGSGGAPLLPSKLFHDIVLGDNGLYPATTGWDFTTGLGTFDVHTVASGIAGYTGDVGATSSGGGTTAPSGTLYSTINPSATKMCVYPGVAVVPNSASTAAIPPVPGWTLESINIDEPWEASYYPTGRIEISLTLDSTSTLPPQTTYYVFFTAPNGTTYYVSYNTTNGATSSTIAPAFTYGYESAGTAAGSVEYNTSGTADADSYIDTTNNRIVWRLSKSLIPALEGDHLTAPKLTAVSGQATVQGGVSGVVGGLVTTVSQIPSATSTYAYQEVSNPWCGPENAPIPSFTSTPMSGTAPLQTAFDASASSDPDTAVPDSVVSYSMSFGDGSSTVTQASPKFSHTFSQAGNYPVTLTVTDSRGATSTASTAQIIQATAPATSTGGSTTGGTGGSTGTGTTTGGSSAPVIQASLVATTATSGQTPLAVGFDASGSTDSAGTLSSYYFFPGDCNCSIQMSSPTFSYTYNDAGTFTAQIVVGDSSGNTAASNTVTVTSTASVTVTAGSQAVAELVVTPTSGSAPLTVQFDGSRSFGANGDPVTTYSFDFGDGTAGISGSNAKVSHIYTSAGSFSPSLTVTDSQGNVSPKAAQAKVSVVGGSSGSGTGSTTTTTTATSTASTGGSGGGAFGFMSLLPLTALAARRRRRQNRK